MGAIDCADVAGRKGFGMGGGVRAAGRAGLGIGGGIRGAEPTGFGMGGGVRATELTGFGVDGGSRTSSRGRTIRLDRAKNCRSPLQQSAMPFHARLKPIDVARANRLRHGAVRFQVTAVCCVFAADQSRTSCLDGFLLQARTT